MEETCPICQSPVTSGQSSCDQCGFHLSNNTLSFAPVSADLNTTNVLVDSPTEAMNPIEAGSFEATSLQRTENANAEDSYVLRMVRGHQTGTEYKLTSDSISIGRNPQCDIFLNDMTVSRIHASISKKSNAYIIADEQSFNGVWVNNRSVNQRTLEQGDFVQIGCFGFIFDVGE